ncbi:hypothetical protein ANCDUO_05270 [Ancylostoma duodenale]|uniref:Uncharacterized protein n=1 Tax=Ancylostoma duodenale TaxID=51022 RepID=A0A0C2D4K7_9BILA|nr:hypothetical protein ANCDUO_05270 [Ancylostoma duodenale]
MFGVAGLGVALKNRAAVARIALEACLRDAICPSCNVTYNVTTRTLRWKWSNDVYEKDIT